MAKDPKQMTGYLYVLAAAVLWSLIGPFSKICMEEAEVGCSWREVGRVLRSLVETERDDRVELIDGVHINEKDGWVLVRPNKDYNACRVIAGSFKEEYAAELSALYEQKLRDLMKVDEPG